MAGAAYRYMVHCAMHGLASPRNLQLALVPWDHPGLEITGVWNTLGMRATVSPSVRLTSCHVPADALLGRPGESLESGVGLAFGLGYAAIYLGAARAALDFAVDFCTRHVAEMTMALDGARLVLHESAASWADADALGRAVLAARAKYVATQAAVMVTTRALQVVGGRSVHRSCPLERLYRDVRTATMMPPNEDRAAEIIGKAVLGVRDDALLARHAG
jgi:alkylation response protein AidB-like acyl-CoA dehydrogenase